MKTLLQKIQGLKYYNVFPELKTILVEFLSTVTSLETNSVIVGKISAIKQNVDPGTPLIIGQRYLVNLEAGDNFTNVGYINDNNSFVAIATTPTTWTNDSTVYLIFSELDIFFNDVDLNLYVEYQDDVDKYNLKITNSKFQESKVFPYIEGSTITRVDNNTLRLNSNALTEDYFKIEVYN